MTGAYKQTVSFGLKHRASWFDSNALHYQTSGGRKRLMRLVRLQTQDVDQPGVVAGAGYPRTQVQILPS